MEDAGLIAACAALLAVCGALTFLGLRWMRGRLLAADSSAHVVAAGVYLALGGSVVPIPFGTGTGWWAATWAVRAAAMACGAALALASLRRRMPGGGEKSVGLAPAGSLPRRSRLPGVTPRPDR